MSKLQSTDKALESRTKTNIKRYLDPIKQEIVEQAKARGHHITKSCIKRVSLKTLKDVSYELFDLHLGKFVITDPEDLIWLGGMTWTNNVVKEAVRELSIEAASQDQYLWQITSGFTYARACRKDISIDAPDGGMINVPLSFDLDFNTTAGLARSSTHLWSNAFEQKIPANSAVRMEVRGVQLVGYVPFTLTARAAGKADCECVVDFWGKHTESFSIDLAQILSPEERTFRSQGRVDAVQGYNWRVDSFTPMPLDKLQVQTVSEGIAEQRLLPSSLQLSMLETSAV